MEHINQEKIMKTIERECSLCEGTGHTRRSQSEPCSYCDGSGTIVSGTHESCYTCQGTGIDNGNGKPCLKCNIYGRPYK